MYWQSLRDDAARARTDNKGQRRSRRERPSMLETRQRGSADSGAHQRDAEATPGRIERA